MPVLTTDIPLICVDYSDHDILHVSDFCVGVNLIPYDSCISFFGRRVYTRKPVALNSIHSTTLKGLSFTQSVIPLGRSSHLR